MRPVNLNDYLKGQAVHQEDLKLRKQKSSAPTSAIVSGTEMNLNVCIECEKRNASSLKLQRPGPLCIPNTLFAPARQSTNLLTKMQTNPLSNALPANL